MLPNGLQVLIEIDDQGRGGLTGKSVVPRSIPAGIEVDLGYRFRAGRKDEFLSWNLGLKEYNVKSPKERLRLYREFVYARGGVDTGKGKILDAVPLPESVERFIQRTRFFTDAGIIGSKEFVRQGFKLFRGTIRPKRERKPHRIKGLDQIYSLKRLG